MKYMPRKRGLRESFDYDDDVSDDMSIGSLMSSSFEDSQDYEPVKKVSSDDQNNKNHAGNIDRRLAKIEELLSKIWDKLEAIDLNQLNKDDADALNGVEDAIDDYSSYQNDSVVTEAYNNKSTKSSSMLEEIQTVLAQQGYGQEEQSAASSSGVNDICTLPSSTYDDDIPEIIDND